MLNPDRVVMITGAAGALGKSAAAAFAQTDASLVLVDIDRQALEKAYPDHSGQQLLVAADLLNASSIRDAVDAALKKFGRIDVLCNIAGGFYYGEPVHETKEDVWNSQFHMNATTLVNAVKAVVPQMLARKSGTIFTIGTAGHMQGHAHVSAYAAAKSAVMRLTESMAEEYKEAGVAVLCLMPVIIDTPKNRSDMPDADFSAWTPPAAIADLMVLLSADAATLMSGCLIPLKGKARSPRAAA